MAARRQSSRDPSSIFFDPTKAYDPVYSAIRLEQAASFIDKANNATESQIQRGPRQPKFCLGIATIARKGASYFQATVGTFLEGLSEEERADIHLILFIAHTDPSQHPAYTEPWLYKLADEVLLYNASEIDIDHIRSLETNEAKIAGREKALFDYTYLLNACANIDTPYVIMLEDDLVALDGWYHRTKAALSSAEEQTREMGAANWLYLRLFYTEEYFGWNGEEWLTYLFFSILVVCFVACVPLVLRQFNHHARSFLPNMTIIIWSGIFTPLLIGLFFAMGRVTMLPRANGVHQMPRFGCCSQAFVFPQSRIPELVGLYTSKHIGYVDVLTEEYANARNEIRWAVTPSIVQHVGRKSSKGVDNDISSHVKIKSKAELTVVEKLWNFEFEMNDAEALRAEHDAVKQRGGS
ncbi:CAZyme family GT109 [Penicillium roqueforti]|nr:CAZyme family GT109 [Penicillium roqueforti]KAI3078061.1 CAZyme family GT109 [Penicillium roqueforti]KAI3105001.1 CAZyme family GT109 [Penicillium roqueforti]KAI3134392.1 CAZyme family GT109 [Penicillium roqueforti]KAI3181219.1 CAZyme family GT109 [Penicillium roqueforti]